MDTIYIIKDSNCKINVDRVASLINNICAIFRVEIVDNNYALEEQVIVSGKTTKKYHKILKSKIVKRSLLVLVTSIPYDDDSFFEREKGLIILSFDGWKTISDLPKENGLLYFICEFGLDYFQARLSQHRTITGCLNDYLGDKKGIDRGMVQACLCSKCLKNLRVNGLGSRKKQLLEDIQKLLAHLSNKSKWTKSIFEGMDTPKSASQVLKIRRPIKIGEINVLIASPGDTEEERDILINKLERNFWVSGYEESKGFRVKTRGWEDLAAQTGYPQDVINRAILPNIDIVIAVLKHRLGTPTVNKDGSIRAESGTAEEIYYAIEKNTDKVFCMLYVFSEPPTTSPDLNDNSEIVENWKRVQDFKSRIQSKVIYKEYDKIGDLLGLVVNDVAKNIETYFVK